MDNTNVPLPNEPPGNEESRLASELAKLQIRKAKAEIRKAKVETKQLELPWYRKHVFWAPIITPGIGAVVAILLACAGWYFNAERQKLATEVERSQAFQNAIQSISESGGVAMVSASDHQVTYAVTFDKDFKEVFDDIESALWQDEGPTRVEKRRPNIDSVIAQLRSLPRVSLLRINSDGWHVTNEGMRSVGELRDLETLLLSGKDINDQTIKRLGNLTNLRYVTIASNQVTDSGLFELTRLERLEGISIYSARLTDDGISQLRNLRGLRTLELIGSGLTSDSIEKISGISHRTCLPPDWASAL